MYEESKKLIYIRIVIGVVCLLFISMFVFLIRNIQQSTKIDDIVIEETTVEEKVVFNFDIAPGKQRNILKWHEIEYEDQLYHYLYDDEKMINTAKISPVSSYDAIIGFGNANDIINIYSKEPLKNIITMIFSDEEIDYMKYAFTDNYIEKHPVSLKKEFNEYFKENYVKHGIGKRFDMDFDYHYSYNYNYNIGIDRENQFVVIDESKSIDFVCEDGTGGSIWGEKGSKYEGEELYADLKTIYFKYKLDEKGYLDDVWFDHIEVLASESDLDKSVPQW